MYEAKKQKLNQSKQEKECQIHVNLNQLEMCSTVLSIRPRL